MTPGTRTAFSNWRAYGGGKSSLTRGSSSTPRAASGRWSRHLPREHREPRAARALRVPCGRRVSAPREARRRGARLRDRRGDARRGPHSLRAATGYALQVIVLLVLPLLLLAAPATSLAQEPAPEASP